MAFRELSGAISYCVMYKYLCGKLNHVDGLKQGTGDIMDQLHIKHTAVVQAPPHKYNIYTIGNDYR